MNKSLWKQYILDGLKQLPEYSTDGSELKIEDIILETPPKADLGDLAFPMFPYARIFRKSPSQIAQSLKEVLESSEASGKGSFKLAGPYMNIFLNRPGIIGDVINNIEQKSDTYGCSCHLAERKIMVEFSCPNTNKPLHLGHLRNDALGESVSRILSAAGGNVMKVNLINNRGVHICKSMLAYQNEGANVTPESTGKKGDHLVGDYYVKFNQWAKEHPEADKLAQEMLIKWEDNDLETRALWQKMNNWTLEGIQETYERTGVSFDKVYYESDTYVLGKENIQKGLENDVFYKAEDGSIRLDLSEIGLDNKVLLRSDGTSVYITQDVGKAIERHKDFPFDQLVYVVGAEQQYHFQVLFYALKKLGHPWAKQLFHLSYGMVNLPEGKMKSREGTVVDADDLLDNLTAMAEKEIISKGRQEIVADAHDTASKIGLAALHYYLLSATPSKDMIYNPAESLSFAGNTGPYLQYVGARVSSMGKKWEANKADYAGADFKPDLLDSAEEWELVKLLGSFEGLISQAADEMNPALITTYLYETAKTFSRFYHEHQVLNSENPDLSFSRMKLANSVKQVLKNAFYLINIPYLDVM